MNEISKEYISDLVNKKNPLLLDIGCYDGKDTVELYNQFENATVYCFEADPRSQELFERANELYIEKTLAKLKNIHLQKCAVGNSDGYIEFHMSDSDTRRHYNDQTSWSASGSIKKPKGHLELFKDVVFNKTIKVKCRKLDTWFTLYKKQVEHFHKYPTSGFEFDKQIIDFIWCDINGAEQDFILGGLKTLEESTRYLYIEFSDKELYEGQVTKDWILNTLCSFELVGIYNYQGNFGNLLLKNKNL